MEELRYNSTHYQPQQSMKVTGEVYDAVSLHRGKRPQYALNKTLGGRHSRPGSFRKDKFLAPASNPATSST